MPENPDEIVPDMGEGLRGDARGDKKSPGIWDNIKTIFYAVMIAVFVRTFAYEPFSIPSGSMIPNLLVGDYLFVSKFSYGYSRHSFPFSLPLVPGPGRVMFDAPVRGDIAVFKLPSDGKTDYIKRIIGLPGDRVQVKRGILHINDEPVWREPAGNYTYRDNYGRVHNANSYVEILPGGNRHLIIEEGDNNISDNTPVYVVPEGHYFAMGDNRDNSKDSRFLSDVGFIPAENLVGRAEVIVFSTSGSLLKFWEWGSSIRGERFLMGINRE